jgi:hypothetical protein
VEGEVAFFGVEVAEGELGGGDFEFIGIAGGEHEFAGFFLGVGVAAEEGAEVALEAWGELVEGDFAAELGGGDEDEEVFLSALAGGVEGGLAEAVDEELEGAGEGSAGLADFGESVEFLVARHAAEFEDGFPVGVEEFAVGEVGVAFGFECAEEAELSGEGFPVDEAA